MIKDKKSAECFVAALEASEQDATKKKPESSEVKVKFLTDKEEIKALIKKKK